MTSMRYFSGCIPVLKQVPENLKGRSKSSQEWLIRQLKDPYVEKAKMENYRCRSAFKLLEINEKHNILLPGMCVIDCGAAPGSWSQVAVRKVNADGNEVGKPIGSVISVDRLPIHPIKGAIILGGCDFMLKDSQSKILQALNGQLADIVVSDMAPNATGVRQADHESILVLAYSVVRFCFGISNKNASLLIKLWDGGGTPKFVEDLKKFYSLVKRVRPPSSRSDSSELFVLAKHFVGVSKKI